MKIIRRINCASRCKKKIYLSSAYKNLEEPLKNELNHDDPLWRTPETKGLWDKMKDERIRLKPCGDLDGGSDEMTEEIWTLEKKIWKHLELEFIHQEQTPKEGINHLDEIRIRFIVCLSFIKLDRWQAMDLAYYLFFLKRIQKWHRANLRRSSWTTGRIEKNEWINMITKEVKSWTNHR